jgi:hypothetical protein
MLIEIGRTYSVLYPFIRDEYDRLDMDGEGFKTVTVPTWKPGVRFEHTDNFGDAEAFADGLGSMSLEVIDIHKPGRFPERVFYVRKWIDPDGKEFGKGGLRIAITSKFKRLAGGYRHEYEMAEQIKVPA